MQSRKREIGAIFVGICGVLILGGNLFTFFYGAQSHGSFNALFGVLGGFGFIVLSIYLLVLIRKYR
jgi:hypothetical protein